MPRDSSAPLAAAPALPESATRITLPTLRRICICGGPRTGKTSLSSVLEARGYKVRHTDDLVGKMDWSAASEEIARAWFDGEAPWVVEGTSVVRALRKWLIANLVGKPCDRVVYLTTAHEALKTGQASMAKGVESVWLGKTGGMVVRDELLARGVEIQFGALAATNEVMP